MASTSARGGKAGSQPSCWECQRRKQSCDGNRPTCARCVEAGLVCPGYVNQRPLTWLTPGKVVARPLQRRKPRKVAGAGADATKAKAKETPAVAQAAQVETTRMLETVRSSRTPPSPALSIPSSFKPLDISPITWSDDFEANIDSDYFDSRDESSTDISTVEKEKDSRVAIKQGSSSPISISLWQHSYAKAMSRQQTSSIYAELRVQEHDLWDAIDYYTTYIYLPAYSEQFVPSAYFRPNVIQELLSQFDQDSRRNAMIATTTVHKLSVVCHSQGLDLDPHHPGTVAHMWKKFFHHIGLAVRALNEEISRQDGILDNNIFLSILLLLGSEACMSSFVKARAHVDGFLAIIRLRGGLGKLVASPGTPKDLLLGFIVSCTIANTTSPCHAQIADVSTFDIADLYHLYIYTIYPPFVCPPHLFLDIVRINRLRLQSANPTGVHYEDDAQAILADIDDFSPERWVESSGLPHPEICLLVARIFHCTVAIYAMVSLSIEVTQPGVQSAKARRERLFELLESARGTACKATIFWPIVVAGATSETVAEVAAVHRHMDYLSDTAVGYVAPVKMARRVLKRYWNSSKTGWDVCFNSPNGFM